MQAQKTLVKKMCTACFSEFETDNSRRSLCDDCRKMSHSKASYRAAERRVAHHAGLDEPNYVKNTCSVCSKEFYTLHKREWCSNKCKLSFYAERARCSNCGELLKDKGVEIKRIGGCYFCSDECREEFRHKKAVERGAVHSCPNCGKEVLNSKGLFCNKECRVSAIANGWTPPKPEPLQPTMVNYKCAVCGKVFQAPASEFPPQCCSMECNTKLVTRLREASAKKKEAEAIAKGRKIVSQCAICRVSYKDCVFMFSNRTRYPDNAVVVNGNVIECPDFR